MPKPYIPNIFRNNDQQLNNIINNDENKLPSYADVFYNNDKDLKKNNNIMKCIIKMEMDIMPKK